MWVIGLSGHICLIGQICWMLTVHHLIICMFRNCQIYNHLTPPVMHHFIFTVKFWLPQLPVVSFTVNLTTNVQCIIIITHTRPQLNENEASEHFCLKQDNLATIIALPAQRRRIMRFPLFHTSHINKNPECTWSIRVVIEHEGYNPLSLQWLWNLNDINGHIPGSAARTGARTPRVFSMFMREPQSFVNKHPRWFPKTFAYSS